MANSKEQNVQNVKNNSFFITTMEQNVQNVLNTLFSLHYYGAKCAECPK